MDDMWKESSSGGGGENSNYIVDPAMEHHNNGQRRSRVDSVTSDSSSSWSDQSSPLIYANRPTYNIVKVDCEWRSFLACWNSAALRLHLADQIPLMIALFWQDIFVDIVDASNESSLHCLQDYSLDPMDKEALKLARNLFQTVVSRTKVSAAAFLLAIFFMNRYRCRPGAEIGRPGSQYRVFVVSLLLAHKYTEDHPYSNRIWAQLADIPLPHINIMEREFLTRIDHRLGVKLREFQWWVVALEAKFQWNDQISAGNETLINTNQNNIEYRSMPLPPPPPVPINNHTQQYHVPITYGNGLQSGSKRWNPSYSIDIQAPPPAIRRTSVQADRVFKF